MQFQLQSLQRFFLVQSYRPACARSWILDNLPTVVSSWPWPRWKIALRLNLCLKIRSTRFWYINTWVSIWVPENLPYFHYIFLKRTHIWNHDGMDIDPNIGTFGPQKIFHTSITSFWRQHTFGTIMEWMSTQTSAKGASQWSHEWYGHLAVKKGNATPNSRWDLPKQITAATNRWTQFP